jgi:hypothetical protein
MTVSVHNYEGASRHRDKPADASTVHHDSGLSMDSSRETQDWNQRRGQSLKIDRGLGHRQVRRQHGFLGGRCKGRGKVQGQGRQWTVQAKLQPCRQRGGTLGVGSSPLCGGGGCCGGDCSGGGTTGRKEDNQHSSTGREETAWWAGLPEG